MRVALLDMRVNWLRSLLSLLGVVIGIASVTVILAVGVGTRELVREKFTAMGLLEHKVMPTFDPRTRRSVELDAKDVELLKGLPFVEAVYPEVNLYSQPVRSLTGLAKGDVLGMAKEAIDAGRAMVSKGRSFLPLELDNRSQVCLISEELVPLLFPGEDPVGKSVWVDGVAWEVVGIFPAKKLARVGQTRDKLVLMPLQVLLRQYPEARLQTLVVRVRKDFEEKPGPLIKKALARGDAKKEKLYQVLDWTSLIEERDKTMRALAMAGALIALITLLVGEIGVMNVMLTSVAERTREIGLRRALGARKVDILFQFLMESGLFSASGAVLGALAGIALSQLIAASLEPMLQQPLRATVLPSFVFLEILLAMILGIVFGVYPASQAARLSPAEALRAE